MKRTILILIFSIALLLVLKPESQDLQTNIFLNKVSSKNNEAIYSLNIQETTYPLLGIAFHLSYPDDLKFKEIKAGSYFDDQTPTLLSSDQNGKLIVGLSLNRTQTLKAEAGQLLELTFQSETPESNSNFTITNTRTTVLKDNNFVDVNLLWEIINETTYSHNQPRKIQRASKRAHKFTNQNLLTYRFKHYF